MLSCYLNEIAFNYFNVKYPNLNKSHSYWYLFNHILKTQGKTTLAKKMLRYFCNTQSAIMFLNNFKKDVLPNLTWHEHIPGVTARVVDNDGFDNDDWCIIKDTGIEAKRMGKENAIHWRKRIRMINVFTHKKLTRRKSMGMKDIIRSKSQQNIKRLSRSNHQLQMQKTHIEYHLSNPDKTFVNIVNKNELDILDYYEHLQANKQLDAIHDGKDYGWFYKDITHMMMLLDFPTPYYQCGENSARIYPMGNTGVHNFTAIDSTLRKTIFKNSNCYNVDLQSAQLAILAMMLNYEELSTLLKELQQDDKSIWDYFFDTMCLKPQKHIKKALKVAIYTISFGGGLETVKKPFIKHNVEHIFDMFIQIPIIVKLLKLRKKRLDKLAKEACDARGLSNGKEVWATLQAIARSELALEAQLYEQILMHEIYLLAIKENKKTRPSFKILVNIHDGLIIQISNNKNSTINDIKKVVKQKANALKIVTNLDVEEIP